MRNALPVVAALFLCLPAQSAERLPNVKGADYPVARQALERAGILPNPVVERDDICAPGRKSVCSKFDETISCLGTGIAYCEFLFASKDRKKFWIVRTEGEGDGAGNPGVVVSTRRITKKEFNFYLD